MAEQTAAAVARTPISMKDRYHGAVLGSAIGDAMGTTVEFMPPGSFKPVTDITGGGKFKLEAGEWTDDTSMSLILATSLIEKQTCDVNHQLAGYVRWYRHGHLSSNGQCFDIGMATLRAVLYFEQHSHSLHSTITTTKSEAVTSTTNSNESGSSGGSDEHKVSDKKSSSEQSDRGAGNGSLMRLASIPLFYRTNPIMGIAAAVQQSQATHLPRQCSDACRYMTALVIGALNSATKSQLLQCDGIYVPDGVSADYWILNPLHPEIAAVAAGSFRNRSPPDIQASGYVVSSLEAALWAFYRSETFEEGCLLAANLGNDADTVAAIYGYLAGAYYGADSIPSKWRSTIVMASLIEAIGNELYSLTSSSTSSSGSDAKVKELSGGYQSLITQLNYLESAYETILRKTLPGPHRYTSLSAFDTDTTALKDGFTKLAATSATPPLPQLLVDFEKRLAANRRALEPVLSRPKMAALFGAGGGAKLLAGAKTRTPAATSTTTP